MRRLSFHPFSNRVMALLYVPILAFALSACKDKDEPAPEDEIDPGVETMLWDQAESPTSETLNAVAVTSSAIVAVGENGTIVRSEDGGITWSTVPSPTAAALLCVWGRGDVFVVGGDAATILRSEDAGRSWTSVVAGVDVLYHKLTATQDGTLYVLGRDFVFSKSTDLGKTWEATNDPSLMGFEGISAIGNELVGVSESSFFLQKDTHDGWYRATVSISSQIDVVATASGRAVSINRAGVVSDIDFSTDSWVMQKWILRGYTLNAVWGSEDLFSVFVAADYGLVWNYGAGTIERGPSEANLLGISGDASQLVAVGVGGTILTRKR